MIQSGTASHRYCAACTGLTPPPVRLPPVSYTHLAMKTGWQIAGSKWYYLDGSGKMKTGWIQLKGKWYYLSGSGAMQTGWVKSKGYWYYLGYNGDMKTGWITVDLSLIHILKTNGSSQRANGITWLTMVRCWLTAGPTLITTITALTAAAP